MGYYIPNNVPIESRPNVERISVPISLNEVAKDEAIICAVDNIMFTAYGFAYSESELAVFKNNDGRLKKWYKMPLTEAKELSGYR